MQNNNNILWEYKVYSKSLTNFLKIIDEHIENSKQLSIFFLNTWKLYLGEKDRGIKEIFKQFDYILPDGQSIVFASRILNNIKIEYISGAELFIKLIEIANKKNYSVFFLGSPKELLRIVEYKIKNCYPNIKKVESQHGYYDLSEEDSIVNKIANFDPDLLFIAFGSPRKELFIHKYKKNIKGKIVMGVGGSYEVFIGYKKINRIIKKMGMRWLHRIIQDPFRLSRRYSVCNSYFLYMMIQSLVKKKFIL